MKFEPKDKDNLIIVHITDIHGVPKNTDPATFFTEELSTIYDTIESNISIIDMVIISGDLMDSIYKGDDPRIITMVNFVHVLANLSKSLGFKLRILKGTETHDGDQLRLFKSMMFDPSYDIKIIENPYQEKIDGISIRYLPETFIDDYGDYKSKYLTEKCDIIFFHGTIDKALPFVKTNDITQYARSIVFKVEDLHDCVNIFARGGHIHQKMDLTKRVGYIESFVAKSIKDASRLKGFEIVEIDTVSKTLVSEKFVHNKGQTHYLVLDMTEDFLLMNSNQIKMKFLDIKKRKKYKEFITIMVETDGFGQNSLENLNDMKIKYGKEFDFRIGKPVHETTTKEMEEKEKIKNFMLSPEIPIEDKIVRLFEDDFSLREKYGLEVGELTTEIVKEVIYN